MENGQESRLKWYSYKKHIKLNQIRLNRITFAVIKRTGEDFVRKGVDDWNGEE